MTNKQKKIFITGGTGTLGASLIESFSKNGFSVFFQFSSNEKKAKELELAFHAKAYKINFNEVFKLPNLDFDVVINNSGINISDVLTHEVEETIWEETLNVNLTAPFKVSKFYLPKMIKKKWGRIININSIYGIIGVDYNSPYNCSKHGLSGLTKSIAKEYASHGITCNEICPGAIQSELMNRIANRVSKEENTTPEKYLKDVASKYPPQRLVLPIEVSALAIFLASNEASFINGSSIAVDGGLIC